MILSYRRSILKQLDYDDVIFAIKERRTVIREHRDQRGDDRCWLDDWLVWRMLDDTLGLPTKPPKFEDAMMLCRQFWTYRRSEMPEPIPINVIFDPGKWDNDLFYKTGIQFLDELVLIQETIRAHRDVALAHKRPLAVEDDRKLYYVLPEKVPADFRLPPEDQFLGESGTLRIGCPVFWKSHMDCKTICHNLHQWGPCNPVEPILIK